MKNSGKNSLYVIFNDLFGAGVGVKLFRKSHHRVEGHIRVVFSKIYNLKFDFVKMFLSHFYDTIPSFVVNFATRVALSQSVIKSFSCSKFCGPVENYEVTLYV